MKIALIVLYTLLLSACGPNRWESGSVTLTCGGSVVVEDADWVNYPTNNLIYFSKESKRNVYRIRGGETCSVEGF